MYEFNAENLSFYIKNEQKYKVVEYISSSVAGNPTLMCVKMTCLFMTINVLFNDLFLIKIYGMDISLHESKHE